MKLILRKKKYFNGNIMNERLYLLKVFYLRYGCKIEISWTDSSACVFLTLTKLG